MILYHALWQDSFGCDDLFSDHRIVRYPDELTESNAALILWGGEDIHPKYYNQPSVGARARVDNIRDELESALLDEAIKKQMLILGVCRGAQWLAIKAGGALFQHVSGHSGRHEVITKEGRKFYVNSIHHQMMDLRMVGHELLAWTPARSNIYQTPTGNSCPSEDWVDPELVWFPTINGLAIQWHPEMMEYQSDATEYLRKFLTTQI